MSLANSVPLIITIQEPKFWAVSFAEGVKSDVVIKIPKGFQGVASSNDYKYTIIQNLSKKIFGVQFHPELKSRPFSPHKIFISFIDAAIKNKNLNS